MLSIFLGKHKRKINSKQLIASWVDVGPNSAVGANSLDCETSSYQISKNYTHLNKLCINSVNFSKRKTKNLLKQLEPISRLNMYTTNYYCVLKRPQTDKTFTILI